MVFSLEVINVCMKAGNERNGWPVSKNRMVTHQTWLIVCAAWFARVFFFPTQAMTSAKIAGRYAPESFTKWEELQQSVDVHVLRDLDEWEGYEDVSSDLVVHIELRKWADLAAVAPCSANTLAKMALGLCDNLATSFLRAWDPEKPLVLAPAMNTIMWEHPSTAKHLKTLEDWSLNAIWVVFGFFDLAVCVFLR